MWNVLFQSTKAHQNFNCTQCCQPREKFAIFNHSSVMLLTSEVPKVTIFKKFIFNQIATFKLWKNFGYLIIGNTVNIWLRWIQRYVKIQTTVPQRDFFLSKLGLANFFFYEFQNDTSIVRFWLELLALKNWWKIFQCLKKSKLYA